MNLSVGLRGDIKNTKEILDKYGDKISGVYIAAPPEIMGTGRYTNIPVTEKDLEIQSKIAHEKNVNVNILLNGSYISGRDFEQDFENKLENFLQYLQHTVKADSITATLPYIIRIISDYRNNNDYSVEIVNSTFSDISTVEEAKQYEALGVDIIMPSQHMNRNFPFLRNLKNELKDSTKIKLLMNTGCVYQCIWRHEHASFTTLFSENRKSGTDPFIENCEAKRTNPLVSLATPFIRPEDICQYEDLGIDYFKISSRTQPTEWVMNIIEAYLGRSYDGNIVELGTSLDISKYVFLDNKKLDGLLQFVCEKPEEYLKLCEEYFNSVYKKSS